MGQEIGSWNGRSYRLCCRRASSRCPNGQAAGATRHWSAEAMSIISEPAHCEMLKLIRLTSFKPNCIWLSQQLGVNVDEVNIVLSRLLRLRLLSIDERGSWHELTGLKEITSKSFLRIGLARQEFGKWQRHRRT